MRLLSEQELKFVSGAHGQCTPGNSGGQFPGVGQTSSFGDNLVNIYEGAVAAFSHVIERVARAL